MILTDNELEKLFQFKWTIEKYTQEELVNLRESVPKEEVLLSLKLSIPRENNFYSYYLLPLTRVHIREMLIYFDSDFGTKHEAILKAEFENDFEENFRNEEGFEDKEEDQDFDKFIDNEIINFLMSTITFASRTLFVLTEHNEVRKVLKDALNIPTFEERKEALLNITQGYIIKTMCKICKEENIHSEEFIKKEMEYAHNTSYYDNAIEAVNSIKKQVLLQDKYMDNNFVNEIINNTFCKAILYIKDLDLSDYEKILDKKIPLNDMIESVEILKDKFTALTSKEKALGQFKVKNHPLSFILEDIIVVSKYNNTNIFRDLIEGIINASVSENIIKSISKNKEKKLIEDLSVLEEYDVDENKIFVIKDILNLYKSKKYIVHIPTIAISNSYFGLSEKQTISLSKFLLPSLNKNTAYKHYPTLHHWQIKDCLSFIE